MLMTSACLEARLRGCNDFLDSGPYEGATAEAVRKMFARLLRHGDPKAHFLHFVAEMRALTL